MNNESNAYSVRTEKDNELKNKLEIIGKFANFCRNVVSLIVGIALAIVWVICGILVCFTGVGLLLFPVFIALGVLSVFFCKYLGKVAGAFIDGYAAIVESAKIISYNTADEKNAAANGNDQSQQTYQQYQSQSQYQTQYQPQYQTQYQYQYQYQPQDQNKTDAQS